MRKVALAGVLTTLAVIAGADTTSAKPPSKILVNSGESIRCPAGAVACTATMLATGRDARNRSVTLGGTTITIAPAATARLIFKLDHTGRHLLLTRGPLQAKLTIAVSDGAGAPIVMTHSITIGVPKPHRHRR